METLTRSIRSSGLRALVLVFAVALVAACDEEKPADGGAGSGSSGGSATSSGGSSKLADYAGEPCRLMSDDDVRAVVPGLPADAEHYTGTRSLRMCQYSWPSGRMASREVMGRTIEYAVDNVVCLKWIRKVKSDDPLARFRNSYRTMTEEEKAEMKAALERQMNKKVESGEISRDGMKLGAGMTDKMFDGLRFEPVSGVGTAAAWGGTKDSIGLKVLDVDWEFEVSVNVSDDEGKNREAAVALAKRILANAK